MRNVTSFFRVRLGCCLALCAAASGCWLAPDLSSFAVHAAAGPSGSLLAYGECAVPDGTLLLIQARGGENVGAQLESTILTPVVKRRFYADLGLFEPLSYRLQMVLSPAFNPRGALPKKPYKFRDRGLVVREDADGWEIRREASFRLGAAADEQLSLQRHLKSLTDAQKLLDRFAASLREIDEHGRAADLAHWRRLYLEGRRGTALETDGVDPLFPALHGRLKEMNETLERRFQGVLAKLTGAAEEVGKWETDWPLVEQRLAKCRDELTATQRKIEE